MSQTDRTDGTHNFRYDKTIVPRSDVEFDKCPTVVKVTGDEPENWYQEVYEFISRLKNEKVVTDYNQIAFLFNSVRNADVKGLIDFLEAKQIPVFAPRSAHEVFIDETSYLKLYKLTVHEFAMRMIRDVLQTTEVEQDLLSPITSVKVRLVEEDGNAFSILGRCRAAMRKAGYPQAFIDTFVTEATAGNYDDLLATVMRYVVVE